MTPEQRLLLRCAVPYPRPEQLEEIGRLLRGALDWPEITAQASKHGLSQMLFYTIQQIDVALPEAVREELRQRFEGAIRRNLFLTGELLRLIQLLSGEGITAVPFKGPVLAESLYGSLARRVFGDLDILVHVEDKEKVRGLVSAEGYTHQFHPDSADQFVKPASQIVLEVHWEALSFGSDWLRKLKDKPLPATLPHLAPRLREVKLGGKTINALSPEDTLLILAMHGSKHWWSRLNWLADIAAVIHVYPALDWDWIMEQTNHWQIRRLVFLGLHLAQKLLQVALPEVVRQEMSAEPQLEKLSHQVESMIFIEQNFRTRYIKRPAYFRQLWDTEEERRMVYRDHLALYRELLARLFK